jgi:beta-xylosidase
MIRDFVIGLALIAAPAAASAQATYTNPILYADYSDPDVIRVGSDYYMVASSFHFSPGIPVLHSQDLVTWRIIGHVLPRLNFAPEYDMVPPFTLSDSTQRPVGPGLRYAAGVWAPAIRHHNGLFYVYWATPTEGVFVSTARRPEGPWSPPVTLIDQEGLEDPAPFWDDDGNAWLVHSLVGAGPLILRRMSPDGRRVLDDGEVIVEDRENLPILEGPKLYKRNGWYYIFAPIGGVERGPQIVLRSRNIRGPYEWRVVLEQGDTEIQGPHQGGWVETPSGQGWFAHFNSTGAFGRIVHLQPVRWIDDWPVIGEPIPGRRSGQPVARHAMPDVGGRPQRFRLQDSDEFSEETLGHQWQWNHNPDPSHWSLSERPGHMRLHAMGAEHLVTARNTLTQILQGPSSEITARIDVSNMIDGQRAGLTMFNVRPSWVGVVRENGRTHVTFAQERNEDPGPVVEGRAIDLRATVSPDQTARFSYSLDGGRSFRPIGTPVELRFAWWKGARPALFTFVRARPGEVIGHGWIDVDWFRVERPD